MKKRCVLLFPGQGAQYVGMGKDVFEDFFKAREVFECVSDALQLNLPQLIFHGTSDVLRQTKYSQIAIFTVSMALFAVMKDLYPDIEPLACAGLSLGEYAALCASNKLSLEQGVDLVIARGQYMQEASEKFPGTLHVVLGLASDVIEQVIDKAQAQVWIANLNCPGQVVLSGSHQELDKLHELLKQKGAKRILPLDVSGPFHSGLMEHAKERLREKIFQVKLQPSLVSLVMNVTGEVEDESSKIQQCMIDQVVSTTYWEKSMLTIESLGPELYIELGPGKTLSGLNKKIGVKAQSYSVENKQELFGLEKIFSEICV